METPVKTIAPNTLHICSAAEALALLRKHGGHGNAAFMRSLADAVSDENNHITGTVGDFNNLIDRFEALGDYFDALRVCDFALKIYPRSATLLAITRGRRNLSCRSRKPRARKLERTAAF